MKEGQSFNRIRTCANCEVNSHRECPLPFIINSLNIKANNYLEESTDSSISMAHWWFPLSLFSIWQRQTNPSLLVLTEWLLHQWDEGWWHQKTLRFKEDYKYFTWPVPFCYILSHMEQRASQLALKLCKAERPTLGAFSFVVSPLKNAMNWVSQTEGIFTWKASSFAPTERDSAVCRYPEAWPCASMFRQMNPPTFGKQLRVASYPVWLCDFSWNKI